MSVVHAYPDHFEIHDLTLDDMAVLHGVLGWVLPEEVERIRQQRIDHGRPLPIPENHYEITDSLFNAIADALEVSGDLPTWCGV